MKILRIICWMETFRLWLFDGSPHIDGHDWVDVGVKKVRERYYITSTCQRCGLFNGNTWMDEMMYLRMRDTLPPLVNGTKTKRKRV